MTVLIGELLRHYRTEAKLELRTLANMTELNPSYISKIENGIIADFSEERLSLILGILDNYVSTGIEVTRYIRLINLAKQLESKRSDRFETMELLLAETRAIRSISYWRCPPKYCFDQGSFNRADEWFWMPEDNLDSIINDEMMFGQKAPRTRIYCTAPHIADNMTEQFEKHELRSQFEQIENTTLNISPFVEIRAFTPNDASMLTAHYLILDDVVLIAHSGVSVDVSIDRRLIESLLWFSGNDSKTKLSIQRLPNHSKSTRVKERLQQKKKKSTYKE